MELYQFYVYFFTILMRRKAIHENSSQTCACQIEQFIHEILELRKLFNLSNAKAEKRLTVTKEKKRNFTGYKNLVEHILP